MTVRVYRDAFGEWRWRAVARNGRIVADSGEGYQRRSSCINAVYRFAGLVVRGECEVVVDDGS